MSNRLIILDGILEENLSEMAPDMSDSEYFEIVAAEQCTKQHDFTYDQL